MPRPVPFTLVPLLIAAVLPVGSVLAQDAPDRVRPNRPDTPAARFERRVTSLAAREDAAGRVAAVVGELEALGLAPELRTFAAAPRAGTNVLAGVPGPRADAAGAALPVLMLGAHLDRVAAGRGAIDNASGTAAVLELLGRFRDRPLDGHRVVGVFFDLEEAGLLGSRAFVESPGDPAEPGAAASLPDAFVNFDVFGYGDTLWVATPDPPIDAGPDAPLAAAFRAASRGKNFAAVVGGPYPPSDHLSFRGRVPSVSVSLLTGPQIAETVAFLEAARRGERPRLPAILALIHTPNDVPAAVKPTEAAAGVDAVEAALRRWDRGGE